VERNERLEPLERFELFEHEADFLFQPFKSFHAFQVENQRVSLREDG
jgi:hypothetical protein